MIIVIEDQLEYVYQYLEFTGKYEVKLKNQYNGPLDVYIYSNNENICRWHNVSEEFRNSILEHPEHVNHGILMINAYNKSPKEIEKILDTRLYDSIF